MREIESGVDILPGYSFPYAFLISFHTYGFEFIFFPYAFVGIVRTVFTPGLNESTGAAPYPHFRGIVFQECSGSMLTQIVKSPGSILGRAHIISLNRYIPAAHYI